MAHVFIAITAIKLIAFKVAMDLEGRAKLDALASLKTDVNDILVWTIQNSWHVTLDIAHVRVVIKAQRIRQLGVWCE